MNQTLQLNQRGLLFKLTWPIFIELILQMLVGNVDQIMMSQYSENAVAAIGNVNTIMNFISKSKKEKYVMTPLSFVAAICFWITALKM